MIISGDCLLTSGELGSLNRGRKSSRPTPAAPRTYTAGRRGPARRGAYPSGREDNPRLVSRLPWKGTTRWDRDRAPVLQTPEGYFSISPCPRSGQSPPFSPRLLSQTRATTIIIVCRDAPLPNSSNLGELTFILPSAV